MITRDSHRSPTITASPPPFRGFLPAIIAQKHIPSIKAQKARTQPSLNIWARTPPSPKHLGNIFCLLISSFAKTIFGNRVLWSFIYGGREVQINITKSETLLQSLRQIYILENIFTYHKTKLHYHNAFTSPETNLHFRKQINKTQNTFTSPETNLQMTLTGKGMYQLRD